jgi:hypothetical protein
MQSIRQQIICPKLKEMIKCELERRDYKGCSWSSDLYEHQICHFIADPCCGYHDDERLDITLPGRDEFYRCKL